MLNIFVNSEKPSPVGERMNSLAMGESESSEDVGEEAALLLLAVDTTEPLRPAAAAAFCTLRSVALVSLRKTRSKSSL